MMERIGKNNLANNTAGNRRLRPRRSLVIFLSFLVSAFTIYSLIMPAVTKNTDETTLICEEDHTHTKNCYAAIDMREEALPYEETELKFIDGTTVNPETDGVYADESLLVSMKHLTIPEHFFISNKQTLLYALPEAFVFPHETSGELLYEDENVGTYTITENNELEVSLKPEVIDRNLEGEEIFFDVTYEALLNNDAITEDHTLAVALREDDVRTLQIEEPTFNMGEILMTSQAGASLTDGFKITAAEFGVKHNSWDADYAPFDPNTDTLKSGDLLNVNVAYKVDSKTLMDSPVVRYQLPESLKILNEKSGTVWNGKDPIGTYTISQDGVAEITFNSTYVEKNQKGETIVGHLGIEAALNKDMIDDDGKIPFDFSDSAKYTANVELTQEEKKGEGDLSINKWAEQMDMSTGRMKYVLTASTNQGTFAPITVTDIMEGIELDGEITVWDNNGQQVTGYTVNKKDTGGFEIVLPQLNPSSNYRIEYYGKKDPNSLPITGTEVKNTGIVKSEDNKGYPIGDSRLVTTPLKPDTVKKEGTYNASTGMVDWSVEVNQAGKNLEGWVLEDLFNGEPYTGEVKLKNAVTNQETTVSLPYTFGNTSDRYVVTYSTPSTLKFGETEVQNVARLSKDGRSVESEKKVSPGSGEGGGGGPANPLHKHAGEVVDHPETSTATVSWNISIDTNITALPAGAVITDQVWGDTTSYMTPAQIREVQQAVAKAFAEAQITNYKFEIRNQNWQWVDNLEDWSVQNGAWRITLPDGIPAGRKIEISYQSTVNTENLVDAKKLYNKVDINEKVEAQGEVTYKPSTPKVEKSDKGIHDATTHRNETRTSPISWEVKVTIPEGYKGGDLKLIEHLPKGVTLSKLEVHDDSRIPNTQIQEVGEHVIGNTYPFTTTIDGQDITVVIPANYATLATKQILYFNIEVTPNEDLEWDKNSTGEFYIHTFKNTAEMKKEDGTPIGSDSQEQTIEVVRESSGTEKVDKYGIPAENRITYTVEVNPRGEDLVPGSDTIYLEDVLSFYQNPYNNPPEVDLIRSSVEVYRRNEDGTRGEKLTAIDYAYTYEEINRSKQWNDPYSGAGTATRTLKFTLPDETPLYVLYGYHVTKPVIYSWDHEGVKLGNQVTLNGHSDDDNNKRTENAVEVQKSHADASLKGLIVNKLDSTNNGIALPGAVFNLYMYDKDPNSENYDYYPFLGEDGQPVRYVTNESGEVAFPNISGKRAYKLVEVEAPTGYTLDETPIYFLLTDPDVQEDDLYQKSVQANNAHKGGTIGTGGDITVENEPRYITVRKKWVDAEGNPKQHTEGSVSFQLMRKGESQADNEWKPFGDPVEVKADSGGNWLHTWVIDELYRTTDDPYVFKVAEAEVSGYEVSYSDNNLKGIRTGVITVTNKETETFELPKTGGQGTSFYTICGIALMSMAAGLYVLRKKLLLNKEVSD